MAALSFHCNFGKMFSCRGAIKKVFQIQGELSVTNRSRFLSSLSSSTFKFSDLEIERTTKLKPKPDWDNLLFGKTFADHMLSVEWTVSSGWSIPRIHPVRPLNLHPGAKVLHYAQELFEGLKAYRGEQDGVIRLFRPDCNMERMNDTATRACLPNFDSVELIKCINKLIDLDQDWVPRSSSSSLYVRPTMIGTEPALGIASATECLLYVLIGPVGPYFPTGFKPIALLADPDFVRAWPGGTGDSKMGSNYAPTLYVGKQAEKQHCQQVLWLYGEDEMVTEVGAMNVMMYWTNKDGEKELITPPLSGVILPGVTRRSLLELARNFNAFKVSEKNFTMGDLVAGLKENRVHEFFGAGTACVVAPVNEILYKGERLKIPTMEGDNQVWFRLQKALTDIQYGRVLDHPWQWPIDKFQIETGKELKAGRSV